MPLVQNPERGADGRPVLTEEGEEIRLAQSRVEAFFGNDRQGMGTLYVTTRNVFWLSDEDPQKGHGVDFPFIALHAISRDPAGFPKPCIYCQLDGPEVPYTGASRAEDEDGEDEEMPEPVPEVRYAPEDPGQVDRLYAAFCDCAALNPDPVDEDEGDFFYDEAEVMAGIANNPDGAARLAQYDALLAADPNAQELGKMSLDDRYADAEEEDEEEGEEAGKQNGRHA
eukprot:tig00000691_g3171.t1